MSVRFGVSPEKATDLERRMAAVGVREADLLERFVRGGGPGGQKINKTAVAVYLKHLPTGLEVKVQLGRSQTLNRFFARRLLCDKLAARVAGAATAEEQRIEKIRRQKRRRSRRAKEKLLRDKHHAGAKKELRRPPGHDD